MSRDARIVGLILGAVIAAVLMLLGLLTLATGAP
jgi:tetrahydromethanopterin S-methyltransferase subunit F